MKYSQILASYTEEKKVSDLNSHFFLFYTYRKISFPFTWLFLKLNIKANHVTFLSLFFGVLMGVFFYFNLVLIGILFLFFYYVLDCVDGNISRINNTSSDFGEFLDSIIGIIFQIIFYFSISFLNNNETVLSSLSVVFILLSRYVSLRFLKNKKISQIHFSIINIIKSFPDLIPFLVLIFYIIDCIDLLIIILFTYNLFGLIYVILNILRTFEKKIKTS